MRPFTSTDRAAMHRIALNILDLPNLGSRRLRWLGWPTPSGGGQLLRTAMQRASRIIQQALTYWR